MEAFARGRVPDRPLALPGRVRAPRRATSATPAPRSSSLRARPPLPGQRGSVGQPRDGDPRAAYLLFDDEPSIACATSGVDVRHRRARMQQHPRRRPAARSWPSACSGGRVTGERDAEPRVSTLDHWESVTGRAGPRTTLEHWQRFSTGGRLAARGLLDQGAGRPGPRVMEVGRRVLGGATCCDTGAGARGAAGVVLDYSSGLARSWCSEQARRARRAGACWCSADALRCRSATARSTSSSTRACSSTSATRCRCCARTRACSRRGGRADRRRAADASTSTRVMKQILIALDRWFAGWETAVHAAPSSSAWSRRPGLEVRRTYGDWMVPGLAYRVAARAAQARAGIKAAACTRGARVLGATAGTALRAWLRGRRWALYTCHVIGDGGAQAARERRRRRPPDLLAVNLPRPGASRGRRRRAAPGGDPARGGAARPAGDLAGRAASRRGARGGAPTASASCGAATGGTSTSRVPARAAARVRGRALRPGDRGHQQGAVLRAALDAGAGRGRSCRTCSAPRRSPRRSWPMAAYVRRRSRRSSRSSTARSPFLAISESTRDDLVRRGIPAGADQRRALRPRPRALPPDPACQGGPAHGRVRRPAAALQGRRLGCCDAFARVLRARARGACSSVIGDGPHRGALERARAAAGPDPGSRCEFRGFLPRGEKVRRCCSSARVRAALAQGGLGAHRGRGERLRHRGGGEPQPRACATRCATTRPACWCRTATTAALAAALTRVLDGRAAARPPRGRGPRVGGDVHLGSLRRRGARRARARRGGRALARATGRRARRRRRVLTTVGGSMPGMRKGYLAVAWFVFLSTLAVYTLTVTPSLPFWDSGEFIATSYILGIPHPRARRSTCSSAGSSPCCRSATCPCAVNWLSALSSALAVLFTFLVTVRLVRLAQARAHLQDERTRLGRGDRLGRRRGRGVLHRVLATPSGRSPSRPRSTPCPRGADRLRLPGAALVGGTGQRRQGDGRLLAGLVPDVPLHRHPPRHLPGCPRR